MFTPARFIVVDDNDRHLSAVMNVFQDLGTSCLGIHYDSEHGLDRNDFRGVRVLFIDFHLVSQTPSSDEKAHFSTIAGILEDNISQTGGPFILVIWTKFDGLAAKLTDYLDDARTSMVPHARPLAIMSLRKEKFINLRSGQSHDPAMLRNEIESAIRKNSQLTALLSWESEVQAAAGATLAALVDLVPSESRTSATFASGLDEVLTRLARAAVGKAHVADDPRAAITAALSPLLADRIANLSMSGDAITMWNNAVTWGGAGEFGKDRSGKLNRMLHLAVPPSEIVNPIAWGAVVRLPSNSTDGECVKRLFGVEYKYLLGGEFKIGRDDRCRCRLRLIRVGAVCDHAQNRDGPLQYLLGLEIPCGVERKKDGGALRLPASEWRSPDLMLDTSSESFCLAVNTRYGLSVTRAIANEWSAEYRLREQLLMQLITHASNYMARPGIVSM